MNKRTQSIVDGIKKLGYEPSVGDDGDVGFVRDGSEYFVCFDADDADAIRLMTFSQNFPAERRGEILTKSAELMDAYELAKVYLADDEESGGFFCACAVETLSDAGSFVKFLPRYLEVLENVRSEADAF
ncbi:MAG: hypothetical protein K6E40_14920 [Desulfovibrio sp.]|jgi:hypothetical protein|nr:hypothetical protein [Desulfovibrio sp.]